MSAIDSVVAPLTVPASSSSGTCQQLCELDTSNSLRGPFDGELLNGQAFNAPSALLCIPILNCLMWTSLITSNPTLTGPKEMPYQD